MPPKKSSNQSKFNDKDLVLAKMAGFPAWPSFIMPSNLIPSDILKVQKKNTKFCVIFIPDGDFNWMAEKQLEALSLEKLKQRISKLPKSKATKGKAKSGRTKNVGDALMAAKELDFDEFMDQLDKKHNGEVEDEEEDQEEEEEEVKEESLDNEMEVEEEEEEVKEEIKSEEEELENEEGDTKEIKSEDKTLEVDNEEEEEENNDIKPTKRTRSSNNNNNDKPPINGNKRKSHKVELPNKKLRSNKSINSEEEEEESKSKQGNGNGNGNKQTHKRTLSNGLSASKNLTEDEKQHQLWLCRIKLQRSLIQRNQPVTPTDSKQYPPPTVDELSIARLILHRLVDFPVSIDLLRKTKIHKVLKCIIRDEDLKYSDSFKLHEKCEELLSKWNSLVEALKLEKSVKSMNSNDISINSINNKEEEDNKQNNTSTNLKLNEFNENLVNELKNNNDNNDNNKLGSQPPDESEISGIENSEINLNQDSIKIKNSNGNGHSNPVQSTTSNSNSNSNSNPESLHKQDVPVAASVEG